MKGQVAKCEHREYGFAQVQISKIGENASADALFDGLGSDLQVRSPVNRSSCDCSQTREGLDVSWRPTVRAAS